jgi:ferric-dicitrate binding protein FerR (iron transport regulator)
MKSWFSKWKISTALDERKPWPESLRRKIDAEPELERFAKRAQALGQTLRNLPPSAPPIHDSIMRAVRSAARPAPPRRAPVLFWLSTSGAVAAVAAVCFYLTYLHPKLSGQQALDTPVAVLEMGENMSKTMPSFVMSPLSNEWARVDHDLQSTTQVLLASLP